MRELSSEEIDRKFELEDAIKTLNEKIEKIKTKKDNIDYFLETGNLLFQYYTITDDIASGNVKKIQ